jgi:hypothetical protein
VRLWSPSLLGLTLSLVAQSTPRHVGDAGEYLVMSLNLGRFSRPSLTPDELVQARALFPGDVDIHLEMPELRGPDGRQDLPHFWFYSLLAAPFVRAALAAGAHPLVGFTALNIILLIGLAALDQYLRPTRLAAAIWRLRPALDNPVAEVFAERVAGHERAMPPIATAGCEKVLLMSSEPTAAHLPIVARSLNKPRHVKISVDDVDVVTLLISPTAAEYQTPAFNLGSAVP